MKVGDTVEYRIKGKVITGKVTANPESGKIEVDGKQMVRCDVWKPYGIGA